MRHYNFQREPILICKKCKHGKPHHEGKFGQCTLPMGKYKNSERCNCSTPEYETLGDLIDSN